MKTPKSGFFTKAFWHDHVLIPLVRTYHAMGTKTFWMDLFFKNGIQSVLSSVVAVIGGIILGVVIMLFTNAGATLPGLGTLLGGWIGRYGVKGLGNWLYYVGPLLLAGLSVGFAFKTGLFNIGASGQYTVGMFVAVTIGITGGALGPFHWVVAILGGILGGALWGFIPGFLKAYFNVNEVITSIMFNYIGMFMVNWIIKSSGGLLYNSNKAQTQPVLSSAYTPTWFLRNIFPGSAVDIGFLVAVVVAILMYIILNKTTFGFELKACGLNRNASRYGGINEKRSIILAMTISGALAGLAGALFILASGAYNSGTFYEPADNLLTTGFDGISVALLGMSNPIGIIVSAFFITFIQRGGYYMQTYGFKIEIIDIIVAVIIYFCALTLFLRELIVQYLSKKRGKKNALADLDVAPSNAPPVPETKGGNH